MILFETAVRAYEHGDLAALWEIVIMFDPLVRKYSRDPTTNAFDEDLYMEIRLVLYQRLQSYRLFGCG